MKKTLTHLVVATALAAVTLTATSAQAREFGIDLGSGSVRFASGSVDPLVDDRTISGFSPRVAVEVADDIFAEAQWLVSTTKTNLYVYTRTEMRNDWLSLGGRYRYQVSSWLEGFARAGLGATLTWASITENGMEAKDFAVSPHGFATLGVELLVPRRVFNAARTDRGGFAMGLAFELGWMHTFGQRLLLESQRATKPAMPKNDIDLGTMTMTGLLSRFVLALHF